MSRNAVTARLVPQDSGLAPDDFPALSGIVGEYATFAQAIRGEVEPVPTLATSLQTQIIRGALRQILETGGQGTAELHCP